MLQPGFYLCGSGILFYTARKPFIGETIGGKKSELEIL